VAAFSAALEKASQRALTPTGHIASEQSELNVTPATGYDTVAVAPNQPILPTETTPSADLPERALEPTVYPGSSTPQGLDTPQSNVASETPQSGQLLAPTAAVVTPPLEPTMPVKQKARRIPRISAALLIGLAVLGVLGSLSLLAHYGVIGARSTATTVIPVRGGTWVDDFFKEPDSLIPGGSTGPWDDMADQMLYLPLFYGDAHGMLHPGAATELPTIQNGDVSPDARIWTFHLRPHLVWSDGQPYDARDVYFNYKLSINPQVSGTTFFMNLFKSADVSADHLSITFHLRRSFAPFLNFWVDGSLAPLPAHHFSSMPPGQIYKSPDNLNPQVTSGPFMMSESVPGDHYTLVRNPRYYLAGQGLPYLDKVVIRIAPVNADTILTDLQAGTITSAWSLDISRVQDFQRFTHYMLTTNPSAAWYEAMYFNFHNLVLATHLEVREAIAMAIDQQALIATALHGYGEPLCTDHPSAYHPGYQPGADCPLFNPAAANQLLDNNGWVRGSDGVRTRGGQRLEFEYSSPIGNGPERIDVEAIVKRDLGEIGIKLDIQNYPDDTFFGSFLLGGQASPPTGAVAGKYDIAEWAVNFGYDPDDSVQFACDQIPPKGFGTNLSFYCNPALGALYKQEQATVDPGVRQQIFDQIHYIYLTEFPFITLYGVKELVVVRKGTHNYQPGSYGETNPWEWWCDGGKC
jgi:peptide/nickel transport system substrate-binding protein